MDTDNETIKFNRKLTKEDVIELRKSCFANDVDSYADKFGVHPLTIKNAIEGKTYQALDEIVAPRKLKRKRSKRAVSQKVRNDIIATLEKDDSHETRLALAKKYNRSESWVSLIARGLR